MGINNTSPQNIQPMGFTYLIRLPGPWQVLTHPLMILVVCRIVSVCYSSFSASCRSTFIIYFWNLDTNYWTLVDVTSHRTICRFSGFHLLLGGYPIIPTSVWQLWLTTWMLVIHCELMVWRATIIRFMPFTQYGPFHLSFLLFFVKMLRNVQFWGPQLIVPAGGISLMPGLMVRKHHVRVIFTLIVAVMTTGLIGIHNISTNFHLSKNAWASWIVRAYMTAIPATHTAIKSSHFT